VVLPFACTNARNTDSSYKNLRNARLATTTQEAMGFGGMPPKKSIEKKSSAKKPAGEKTKRAPSP